MLANTFLIAAGAVAFGGSASARSSTPQADGPVPFYLNIYNANRQTFAAAYVHSSGDVAATTGKASLFQINSLGSLSTVSTDQEWATLYLSASEGLQSMGWEMSPSLQTIYQGFGLKTTEYGESLTWEDEYFEHGTARFCETSSKITILFKGDAPEGCELVELIAFRE